MGCLFTLVQQKFEELEQHHSCSVEDIKEIFTKKILCSALSWLFIPPTGNEQSVGWASAAFGAQVKKKCIGWPLQSESVMWETEMQTMMIWKEMYLLGSLVSRSR